MARPKNNRIVQTPPLYSEFKPIGLRRSKLQTINLSLDEYEAIRLADNLGLSHLESSKEMNISRSTFSRLIDEARHKMAKFLVQGLFLQIEGGNIHFERDFVKCNNCGFLFKVSIDKQVDECPECKSDNLNNMANKYGHGRCCSVNRRHRSDRK